MQLTAARPKIMVSADGTGIVSQAGALLLVQTLRFTGLDHGLSAALGRWRAPGAVHDPGKIIADLVVALAMGGDCLADVAMLRAQPQLSGPVASDPVVSRLIAALAADAPRALKAHHGVCQRPARAPCHPVNPQVDAAGVRQMAAPSPVQARAAGLTGRRSKRDALDRLINAVRVGQSRALVVASEPGAGKTEPMTGIRKILKRPKGKRWSCRPKEGAGSPVSAGQQLYRHSGRPAAVAPGIGYERGEDARDEFLR